MAARGTSLEITPSLSIPMSEVRFRYVKSSGPGGQNVNKLSTQAQMTWKVQENESLPLDVRERLVAAQLTRISAAGYLRIHCDSHRDRETNRAECLERLQAMILAVEKPPTKRKKTRQPKRVAENRLKNKQFRSEVKQSRRRLRLDD